MSQYFGIDFSGDHRQWIPGRSKSNIWIAEVRLRAKKPKLHDLCASRICAEMIRRFGDW